MQRLGETFDAPRRSTRWERNRYRHGAAFCSAESVATPLDRNQRARLLTLAEGLERRTKEPGKRNGLLGQSGLQVLRALLLRFANNRTGVCFPSLLKIQAVTGLCRQTIVTALARLERCGLIRITRRIERAIVERMCTVTGQLQRFMTTIQVSNAYGFLEHTSRWAAETELPGPCANAPRPFPKSRVDAFYARLLKAAGSTQ